MEAFILGQEPILRLTAFAGVLALMMGLEAAFPRRARETSRSRRWTDNLGIVVLDTVIVRLLVPLMPVAAAEWAAVQGWGLLPMTGLPMAVMAVLAFLALDLLIYWQHVIVHKVPVLWRLHRVHHSDLEIDTTTGVRFHPLEILLSIAIKVAAVIALGAPVVAVIIFEIVLNATSMFNHANLRLPLTLDRVLRWVIVTPDMHRVHHSVHQDETDTNFGFNITLWDRLFSTYRDQPRDGHDGMLIGIGEFRKPDEVRLPKLLVQPFR